MSASVTDRWVDFIADVSYDDLPSDVIQQTKMYILDHVGCALGGYAIAYGENVVKAGLELGGRPEATVIGSGDKLHCANAAYANGKLSNLTDADEVFYSTKHIGGIPVFSALSVGERANSAPKDIILSTALAYDFAARCGFCGSIFKHDPAAGFVAGRAGTMAFGTFSAAIAALKTMPVTF